MKGHIHSIESFGTVDGPGVRFVVFFQGCAWRCQYCHNPDTWALGAGTECTAREIIEKMARNLPFYETGGITATGGEPLLQLEFLTELFRLAKERGIHTCLDTSGAAFTKDRQGEFDALMKYCDLIMLDIKHTGEGEHKALTGASQKNVLDFMDYLKERDARVWVRHVIIPGITDGVEHLKRLGKYLKEYKNVERVDILPYHTLGVSKYDALGDPYPLAGVEPLSKSDAKKALEIVNLARLS